MQNHQNPLTNEDPLSKSLELESLQYWPIALCLILSNFFGWPAFYVALRKKRWIVAASILIAIIWSIFYHICQSTTYCFTLNLTIWTMSDHISAPSMMAMLIILIVNPRILVYINPLAPGSRFQNNKQDNIILLEGRNEEEEEEKKKLINKTTQNEREVANTFYDAWMAVTTYCYLFLVILATFAHPFSMQNFIIVISFGLAVVFLKLLIIDECRPENLDERISLPDLIIGVILIGISLVFFVLDSWVLYWIFHSLWHIFSFVGVYFFIIGMTNDVETDYSPSMRLYYWLWNINTRKSISPV